MRAISLMVPLIQPYTTEMGIPKRIVQLKLTLGDPKICWDAVLYIIIII